MASEDKRPWRARYEPDNDTYWLLRTGDVKQITREQYDTFLRGLWDGNTHKAPAFNPGDDWLEVSEGEYGDVAAATDGDRLMVRLDGVLRYWVRQEPLPPLPTAPHTVIRVTGRGNSGKWVVKLDSYGETWHADEGAAFSPAELAEEIIAFEVLAYPDSARDVKAWASLRENTRRETAKAVLDKVRPWVTGDMVDLDSIAKEFGVEQ